MYSTTNGKNEFKIQIPDWIDIEKTKKFGPDILKYIQKDCCGKTKDYGESDCEDGHHRHGGDGKRGSNNTTKKNS